MDNVYAVGAMCIKYLQEILPNAENYFNRVSEIADPAYAFTVVFPIASILSVSLAADVLVVSVVAEWTSILLKWILMEDRPYWWVREAAGRPILRHTKLTCETGPGSPSGHCTSATVVGYVVTQWICRQINERTLIRRVYKRRINKFLWIIFCFILVNVTLARLYTATHFPHQCFLGIACGLIVNYVCTNEAYWLTRWWHRGSRAKLVLTALALSSGALGIYWMQRLMGVDPQWSVRLAFKWCSSPDYLHVKTTPLFSLIRDSGAALGLGFSSPVNKRSRNNYNMGVAGIILLFVCSALEIATQAIPTVDFRIYYACILILHAVQPYFVLVVVPFVVTLLTNLRVV